MRCTIQTFVGRAALLRGFDDRQVVPTADLADGSKSLKPLIFIAFPTAYEDYQAFAVLRSGQIATGEIL